MTIEELNQLEPASRGEALGRCCGAGAWIEGMQAVFPVKDREELLKAAEKVWYDCSEVDWREAFEHHPRIGDLGSLKKKFGSTGLWAAGEQSGVNVATEEILMELAAGNEAYEKKFGYIFIVCATGKSAGEMLEMLKGRLGNAPAEEIRIAMGEQNKITLIRLEKLTAMNKITTHILDTARGCPAEGVRVRLWQGGGGGAGGEEIASGVTNEDGRIAEWAATGGADGGLRAGGMGPAGIYRIRFETKEYFDRLSVATFYPFVEICFEIISDGHYHIPLLISPFGYSTYRGS